MSSGTITLRRPRVRGVEERFESRVLPLFARRTKELGALLPELYLHGLAEGDFELAMRGLLGEARGHRCRSLRFGDCGRDGRRSSRNGASVAWRAVRSSTYGADGIYVKAGLERDNAAIWGAVRQVWPEAGEQRCWNHKMRNVLDRLPQREQSEAKDLLRAVVYAPSRAEALKAREVFARRYRPWYPKAVDVLEDDWERMVAFYDFPEDHWKHLGTTNVVESPFAALRLRTTAAKRFKRVESATALIWKLLLVALKRFRRLDAPHLLKDVFEGRKFEDGKPVSTQQRKNAA